MTALSTEIDAVQRMWMFRGRKGMIGDDSFWLSRVVPLSRELGVDPGLILISPMLQEWS